MSGDRSLGLLICAGAMSIGLSACGGSLWPDVEPLEVEAPPTYTRAEFGTPWLDVDGNDCDTRNDVLQRDLTDVVVGPDGCVVLRGILRDPYTGQSEPFVRGTTTSRLVQIDHVYPLKAAWDGGAKYWDFERRVQFANDLDNLVATSDNVNGAKGSLTPPDWTPPLAAVDCAFALRFAAVAATYELPVDEHLEDICPLTAR